MPDTERTSYSALQRRKQRLRDAERRAQGYPAGKWWSLMNSDQQLNPSSQPHLPRSPPPPLQHMVSLLCDLPNPYLYLGSNSVITTGICWGGRDKQKKHCSLKLGEVFGLMCALICLSQGTIATKPLTRWNYQTNPNQGRNCNSRINGLEAS